MGRENTPNKTYLSVYLYIYFHCALNLSKTWHSSRPLYVDGGVLYIPIFFFFFFFLKIARTQQTSDDPLKTCGTTCWRPFSNQSNWLISQLLSEDNGPCKKATFAHTMKNPQYSPTGHCSEGAKECPSAHHTSTYYSGHYCIIIIDWLVFGVVQSQSPHCGM